MLVAVVVVVEPRVFPTEAIVPIARPPRTTTDLATSPMTAPLRLVLGAKETTTTRPGIHDRTGYSATASTLAMGTPRRPPTIKVWWGAVVVVLVDVLIVVVVVVPVVVVPVVVVPVVVVVVVVVVKGKLFIYFPFTYLSIFTNK